MGIHQPAEEPSTQNKRTKYYLSNPSHDTMLESQAISQANVPVDTSFSKFENVLFSLVTGYLSALSYTVE
jgi:hypothetical protein